MHEVDSNLDGEMFWFEEQRVGEHVQMPDDGGGAEHAQRGGVQAGARRAAPRAAAHHAAAAPPRRPQHERARHQRPAAAQALTHTQTNAPNG